MGAGGRGSRVPPLGPASGLGDSKGKGRLGANEPRQEEGEALGCFSPYLLELLCPAESTACKEEGDIFHHTHTQTHTGRRGEPSAAGGFLGQSLWGAAGRGGGSSNAFPAHSPQISPLKWAETLS